MNVYCVSCDNAADQRVHRCPIDGSPMRARTSEIPSAPAGWDYYDHPFLPEQAASIIKSIPPESHHWPDIQRKAPDAPAQYTNLMIGNTWVDETYEHGYYEHPIRFDEKGQITHGVIRLIACMMSGRPLTACVLSPRWVRKELLQ